MGMSDTIIVLDEPSVLTCPEGHALRSVHTKDLEEPSMCTYLLFGGCLYATSSSDLPGSSDEMVTWRIVGETAIRVHTFKLRAVWGPRAVRAYGQCDQCEPVLVRTDAASILGDIVSEHSVFVDFRMTLRPSEPVQVERTSGNRDELKADLRARGLCVLAENEPLAIAHREVKNARDRTSRRRSWA